LHSTDYHNLSRINQQAFRAALDENGAEFPPALCDKLWKLIKAMQVCMWLDWLDAQTCKALTDIH
jgi:hypothetical protein